MRVVQTRRLPTPGPTLRGGQFPQLEMIMQWTRVYLGAAMAALSGVLLCYSWDEAPLPAWQRGGVLLAVVLFVFSGLYLWEKQRQFLATTRPVLELPEDRPPLLGELLVFKYRLISVRTLERALAVQRESKKLLGETLLELGEISQADLEMVLRDQCAYQDGSWRCEPWARRPVREAPRFPEAVG